MYTREAHSLGSKDPAGASAACLQILRGNGRHQIRLDAHRRTPICSPPVISPVKDSM